MRQIDAVRGVAERPAENPRHAGNGPGRRLSRRSGQHRQTERKRDRDHRRDHRKIERGDRQRAQDDGHRHAHRHDRQSPPRRLADERDDHADREIADDRPGEDISDDPRADRFRRCADLRSGNEQQAERHEDKGRPAPPPERQADRKQPVKGHFIMERPAQRINWLDHAVDAAMRDERERQQHLGDGGQAIRRIGADAVHDPAKGDRQQGRQIV